MNLWRLATIATLVMSVGLACGTTSETTSEGVPKMTKEQLKARLGDADLTIVDVRTPKDYDSSAQKIRGARRENPMDVTFWSPYPKDKVIVLYCA